MRIQNTAHDTYVQPKLGSRVLSSVKGEIAQDLTVTAAGIASVGLYSEIHKTAKLAPGQIKELQKAAQAGLKNSGLADSGVKIEYIKEKHVLSKKFIKGIWEDIKTDKLRNSISTIEVNGKKRPSLDGVTPLSKEEFSKIKNATSSIKTKIQKLFDYGESDKKVIETLKKSSGVPSAGNKIDAVLSNLPEDMKEMIHEYTPENLYETGSDLAAKAKGLLYKEGKHISYVKDAKTIVAPSKSLSTSLFNEMGHIAVAQSNGFMKFMSKAKYLSIPAAEALLLVALIKNRNDKKAENSGEKKDGILSKTADGIKNNIGKLTAAVMAPFLIDNLAAAHKGNLIAEGTDLSYKLLNKVKKTNSLYAAVAGIVFASTIIGAKLGTRIRDDSTERAEIKANQKAQKTLS